MTKSRWNPFVYGHLGLFSYKYGDFVKYRVFAWENVVNLPKTFPT